MFQTVRQLENRWLEDRWQSRLKDARVQYDLAAARFKTAGTEFTNRTLPTPDGGLNLVSAIRAETVARREYMRVLRIFTDLVAHGKRPEE